MDWLPLVLLSAFSLASADAVTKGRLADYSARELTLLRFGGAALWLAPLLVVYPLPPVPLAFWGWVAALVPLELLAMLLYVRAICTSPLALTLPYLAFTPMLTAITGLLILGERVSARGLAGIVLVVAGAYLLNSGGARGRLEPFRVIMRDRGSRLMLAVAAIYSLTSVMGKGALRYVPPEAFGPFYYALLGVLTLALFALREPTALRALWRRPGWSLLVGLLMATMAVAHFLALSRAEVAYMIAVKRTSLLFGILYGAILFGEQNLTRHLLAGTLMVLGVALIAT